MKTLTAERLREVLKYDPATGVFTWLVRTSIRITVGKVAGVKNTPGYVVVGIDGRLYNASRLAWLYVKGEWPNGEIDHLNGIRHDNRFENLRDVTKAVNMQNRRRAPRHSKTGLLGVTKYMFGDGFVTHISVAGKARHLGVYKTAQEAHDAYVKAKRQFHEGNLL